MTTVMRLPPQSTPKGLTAFAPTQNLREHFLQFLAVNGALDEPQLEDSESEGLLKLLLEFCQRRACSRGELKAVAEQVCKLTRKRITRPQARRLVARLYGYPQFKSVVSYSRATGMVPNLRTSFKEVHDLIVNGREMPEPLEPEERHAALPQVVSRRHPSVDERLYEGSLLSGTDGGQHWIVSHVPFSVDNRKVMPQMQKFVVDTLEGEREDPERYSWTRSLARATRFQADQARLVMELFEGSDQYQQSQSTTALPPSGVLRLCKLELTISEVATTYAMRPNAPGYPENQDV